MTLRLSDDDNAAVAATAAREHTSKHEVIGAVRAYTGSRQQRLDSAIERVVTRDADLLRRLGSA